MRRRYRVPVHFTAVLARVNPGGLSIDTAPRLPFPGFCESLRGTSLLRRLFIVACADRRRSSYKGITKAGLGMFRFDAECRRARCGSTAA